MSLKHETLRGFFKKASVCQGKDVQKPAVMMRCVRPKEPHGFEKHAPHVHKRVARAGG